MGLPPLGQIVVLSQPPSSVFWDEWFDIGLTLRILANHPALKTGGILELKADLVPMQESRGSSATVREYGTLSSVSDAAKLVVEGEHIMMPLLDPTDSAVKENVTFVRCKIQGLRTLSSGNTFLIRFSAIIETPFTLPSKTILPVPLQAEKNIWIPESTANIRMVTACLQIVADEWPEVWYKDEGGRDKCMQVTVRLVDQRNQIVLSRCIQLYLTLVYDDEIRSTVMRQDKLRLLGSRKNFIDPETGCATLLFRIDDVSKNHQGLGFMIRVDAESSIEDVAPAYSPSVSVRSKRNKRSRELMPIDVDAQTPAVDLSPFSFSPSQSHGSSDLTAVQHALKKVFEWSHSVVQGLHGLRWSVLGHTQLPDGSFDYNQPYHSMQNPNDFNSNTSFVFNNEVQQHLHLLQSFLDSMNLSPVGRSLSYSRQTVPLVSTVSGVTSSSSNSNHPLAYSIPLNRELLDPSQIILSNPQPQFITPRSVSRVAQQQQQLLSPQQQ